MAWVKYRAALALALAGCCAALPAAADPASKALPLPQALPAQAQGIVALPGLGADSEPQILVGFGQGAQSPAEFGQAVWEGGAGAAPAAAPGFFGSKEEGAGGGAGEYCASGLAWPQGELAAPWAQAQARWSRLALALGRQGDPGFAVWAALEMMDAQREAEEAAARALGGCRGDVREKMAVLEAQAVAWAGKQLGPQLEKQYGQAAQYEIQRKAASPGRERELCSEEEYGRALADGRVSGYFGALGRIKGWAGELLSGKPGTGWRLAAQEQSLAEEAIREQSPECSARFWANALLARRLALRQALAAAEGARGFAGAQGMALREPPAQAGAKRRKAPGPASR